MKKDVLTLVTALLGLSFCCAGLQAQAPVDKRSNPEASLRALLDQEQPGDVRTVSRVLRFFDRELEGMDTAVVDRCFVVFDHFLDRVVAAESELFQDVPFPEQEALYELQHGGPEAEETASPRQKGYLARWAALGLSLDVDTGSYELRKDEHVLFETFGARVSGTLKVYLKQRAREYQEGFWRDGALTISPRAVAERIVFWEDFLHENPTFVPGKQVLKEMIKGLTRVLLRGVHNTPPFDPESHCLNEPFREAYHFLVQRTQSRVGNLVRRYVTILKANGFRESETSQAFLDEVLPGD